MIRFRWPENSTVTIWLIKLAMKTCVCGMTYDHLSEALEYEELWKDN